MSCEPSGSFLYGMALELEGMYVSCPHQSRFSCPHRAALLGPGWVFPLALWQSDPESGGNGTSQLESHGRGWLGYPVSILTSHLPQAPKSHRVCEAGAEESSPLLGGPMPHRWRPWCWGDTGYWVSRVLDVLIPPSLAWNPPHGVDSTHGCSFGVGVWGGTPKLKLSPLNPQQRVGAMAWLCLGYPVLVVAHGLVSIAAWLLVFLIPVAKMSARTAARVLLLPPEQVLVRRLRMVSASRQG